MNKKLIIATIISIASPAFVFAALPLSGAVQDKAMSAAFDFMKDAASSIEFGDSSKEVEIEQSDLENTGQVPYSKEGIVPKSETGPSSFSKAKSILKKKIYSTQDNTFYCGCNMVHKSIVDKKLLPSHKECGFEPRKQAKRAARIEWEHVMPAWYFGHQRQCWQEGGRKQCGKVPAFKQMEADLHNLVPAIGEVNGDRSNFSLTMVAGGEIGQYGQCDMIVDFKSRKAQPPMDRRGDIARVYFYMADKYDLNLSKQDIQIYSAWSNQDPVSADELRIHNLKAKYQGNVNPYVVGGEVLESVSTDNADSSEYVSNKRYDSPMEEFAEEDRVAKVDVDKKEDTTKEAGFFDKIKTHFNEDEAKENKNEKDKNVKESEKKVNPELWEREDKKEEEKNSFSQTIINCFGGILESIYIFCEYLKSIFF